MSDIKTRIQETIASGPVVIFMKGSPMLPQCGFSATAVEVLKRAGAPNPVAVDVLQDPEVRQGIKDFSGWPTIPQVYVGGEFLGGSDIVRELYEKGELQEKIAAANSPAA
ncbi:MAG: Grx4 family monothiol glutaredoxin [Deltaproteobacteria bacterium]|nr:Grx4 family monothiol glutaredoxin [Deltaproteobacteria bacterium]